MDRSSALGLLPEPYAVAIRLHDAGRDDAIADALQVAPEAVGPLLRLAEANLHRLQATDHPRRDRCS